MEVTGRNDWSSTLPKENASYFYPSVSSSLILSDLFPAITNNGVLTYLKLRGSWTRVGSDAGPYQLQTLYNGSSNKFAGLALYTLDDKSANAVLKPEQTTGKEGGVEFSLFDDRITFDGSYYTKATRNQIIPLTIAPATGFTQTVINAGQITNKGLEASVTAKPVKMANGFQWTTTFNYQQEQEQGRRAGGRAHVDQHPGNAVGLRDPGARRPSVRRPLGLRLAARFCLRQAADCRAVCRRTAPSKISRQRQSGLDRRLVERVPLQELGAEHAARRAPRRPELLHRQLVGHVRRHSRRRRSRDAKSTGTSRASSWMASTRPRASRTPSQ